MMRFNDRKPQNGEIELQNQGGRDSIPTDEVPSTAGDCFLS